MSPALKARVGSLYYQRPTCRRRSKHEWVRYTNEDPHVAGAQSTSFAMLPKAHVSPALKPRVGSLCYQSFAASSTVAGMDSNTRL